MNRFSKACLLVITLSLSVIALRPIVIPQPALAASPHYQYVVIAVSATDFEMQKELDKHASERWELVSPLYTDRVYLIFRKEAR
jgi:hypothetical protein